ncbi:protein SOSEKI 2 [Rosa rugosa]|uniref:protein SOSEKI 2 n=1 Tax=Rosa rugosa TaxID=74645 RepID=UPI002B4159A2|nr:protein SOSEKI 2 [Rosa rugosa]
MDVRFRRPQTSPDRAKVCMQQLQPRVAVNKPTIKKVQIVYYLSRNGHLEHPHYMEITHLPNQPLRLRDVMDRLTALRGKGMPSLYSWSCKRSYKNGYVWNDLAENDIIYPADGAEYVLKGSELVEGCSERLNQIQISSPQQIQDSNFGSKRRSPPLAPTPNSNHKFHEDPDQYDEQEEEEVDYEDEKTSYTSSTTTNSRCSRGVSTDELEEQQQQPPQTHKTPPESSPLPNAPASVLNQANHSNNVSMRFEDGDPIVTKQSYSVSKAGQGKNSVLLQLIACGSSAVAKAKSTPCVSQGIVKRERSSQSFRKEVVYRSAVKVAIEDEDMITYMSENPRFGNLQAEEKEYFSGSIVESMKEDQRVHSAEPVLKKSNSYNEERSNKAGLGEETVEEEEEKREKAAVRGNCIPRKFCSTGASSKPTRK